MASRENIERQLKAAEPRFARAFLDLIAAARAALDLDLIEELLARGNLEAALAEVLRVAPRVPTPYVDEFVRAGKDAARAINRAIGEIIIDFDQTNDFAVRAMRQNRLRLVTNFTQQQREATRQMLLEGIEEGINPRELARRFRDSIGLNRQQVRAVNNYRRLLQQGNAQALQRALRDKRFDPTLRRAISGERPLTAEQIDRMVKRYEQRTLAHRARTIARTESLRSVHEGTEAAFQQAFEEGALSPDDVTKEWNTARDERVRGSHADMHDQKRPEGEPFLSGLGNALRYPGDPAAPGEDSINCRCAVGRRISINSLQVSGAAQVEIIDT